jgi:hypothetical protein
VFRALLLAAAALEGDDKTRLQEIDLALDSCFTKV